MKTQSQSSETIKTQVSKRSSKSISQTSKLANAGLWLLQTALAVMFVMAGISKLAGIPEMVALFDNIGMGQGFGYVTGILELTGAVLIVVPSAAAVGALLLSGIMLGAVFTHLFLIGGSVAMPGIFLFLSLAIAWGRWNRTWR